MKRKADAYTGASAPRLIDGKALYLVALAAALPTLSVFIPTSADPAQLDQIAAETTQAIHRVRTNNRPDTVTVHSDTDHPTRIQLSLDHTHGRLTTRITQPGLCHRLVRAVVTAPNPGFTEPVNAVLLNDQRLTPAQAIQTAVVKGRCIMAGHGKAATKIQFLFPVQP